MILCKVCFGLLRLESTDDPTAVFLLHLRIQKHLVGTVEPGCALAKGVGGVVIGPPRRQWLQLLERLVTLEVGVELVCVGRGVLGELSDEVDVDEVTLQVFWRLIGLERHTVRQIARESIYLS